MSLRLPIFLLIFIGFLFGSAQAIAEDANPDPDNEYDFSWLDPDKKIYVVQNRKYVKARHMELALNGGIGIGEPYRQRRIVLPRAFYYFNEHWGISVLGGFVRNEENGNMVAIKTASTASSVIPVVRDVQSFIGGSAVWLPFYGKINMFNQMFYIDWHFEAGLGSAKTEIDLNRSATGAPNIEEATYTTYHWGTGMKFFITRNIAARLDYLAVFYKAPTGIDGSTTSNLGAVTDTYDNHFLTLGASYTF
jgi:outer membrane beta-barrel protein